MKRRITALLCVCVLLASSVLMTACGAKYADSKYLGTWNAESAEYAGLELNAQELFEGECTFTLDEKGKVTMTFGEDSKSGKWEEIDGGIQFDGDDEMILKDKNGFLVMEYSGTTLKFEKDQKATED